MLDLALNENGKPVRVSDVSSRQQLSEKYVEQLFARLKKSGYVKSVRGAGGGYVLGKPADRIRVLDVFEALEGSLHVVDCVDDPELCPRYPLCVTHGIWKEIRDAAARILGSITIKKLVTMHRQRECLHARRVRIARSKCGRDGRRRARKP